MSAQTLSDALALIRQCSATLQALQTKTMKMAQGQSAFRPSETELFDTVLGTLIVRVDYYISDQEAEQLPDIYQTIFSSIYDDLVTSKRALKITTKLSRHNLGLRVDTERDLINSEYVNYAETLAEEENDTSTSLDLEDTRATEFS